MLQEIDFLSYARLEDFFPFEHVGAQMMIFQRHELLKLPSRFECLHVVLERPCHDVRRGCQVQQSTWGDLVDQRDGLGLGNVDEALKCELVGEWCPGSIGALSSSIDEIPHFASAKERLRAIGG
jgi:hypothetical protein